MFSHDYASARDRFLRLAGDQVEALPLAQSGPAGAALAIDVTVLGAAAAERVLLVTSGVHGVEGFAGSAVQCAFLEAPPRAPPATAVVLVHALNPWGFAHLRRVNEHNVDLNRNFLPPGEPYSGAPEGYRALNALLNPPSPPASDGFYFRAVVKILRQGFAPLREAVVAGQYEYPHGLFFGGQRLEPEAAAFLDWLERKLAQARHVLALDLHTGIGRFGEMSVFAGRTMPAERARQLGALLERPVIHARTASAGGGYAVRGGLDGCIPRALAHAHTDYLAVEFGTYPGIRMLHALREENRWHHFGGGGMQHRAKRRLLRAFYPDSERWRRAVLAQGVALLHAAARCLTNL